MNKPESPYYLVKVEFETVSDNGKTKKIKSEYLVDAMTCTEAEAKTRKFLETTIFDYEVVSTTKSRIESVIQ
jgi:hypothetical protein